MDVNATWLWDTSQAPFPDTVPPTDPRLPRPSFPSMKTLAADFPCYKTGPITDVHIWGSWKDDMLDERAIFRVSIYSDVPKTGNSYSHPGGLLWADYFLPTKYVIGPEITAKEDFFDPNLNQVVGTDTKVFPYNFYIDPTTAFVQEGTATDPKVYWLGIEAIVPWEPGTTPRLFGWKTSQQVWNDDAVFGDSDSPWEHPTRDGWKELIGPAGNSLDLAFAITTVPEPSTFALAACAMTGGVLLVQRRRRAMRAAGAVAHDGSPARP